MVKEAAFSTKLEPELRAEFMAAVNASHRPASQIQSQREKQEYDEFLRGKVGLALQQIQAGEYSSSEEVEARFGARRAQLRSRAFLGGVGKSV